MFVVGRASDDDINACLPASIISISFLAPGFFGKFGVKDISVLITLLHFDLRLWLWRLNHSMSPLEGGPPHGFTGLTAAVSDTSMSASTPKASSLGIIRVSTSDNG